MSAAGWSPPQLRGVRWCKRDPHGLWCYCVFDDAATHATAAALVAAIPMRGSLQFYDRLYHGQPPEQPVATIDHGAIFVVYRVAADAIVVQCGNHGWSSNWQCAAEPAVVDFLWQARASNVGKAIDSDEMLMQVPGHPPQDVRVAGDILVRKDLYRDRR